MAEVRLRKSKRSEDVAPTESDPSIGQWLMGKTLGGLHTLGSVLNFPLRATWGTLNGLTGQPGGYGNMSLTDSTGGIEASDFLENIGLHPHNDPTKWGVDDFTRFGLNVAGDPTTYVGLGGLTKAGQAVSKTAKGVTKGLGPSIAAGERALLTVGSPLGHAPLVALGTGRRSAALAEKLVDNPVDWMRFSAPARGIRAIMDSRVKGKTNEAIQRAALNADEWRLAEENAAMRDLYGMAARQHNLGMTGEAHSNALRNAAEGVSDDFMTPAHWSEAEAMQQLNRHNLEQQAEHGIGIGTLVDDDVSHFPRGLSKGVKGDGPNGVSFRENSPRERQGVYKGVGGTVMINRILRDQDARQAILVAQKMGGGFAAQKRAALDVLTSKPEFAHVDLGKMQHFADVMVGVPAVREQGMYGNYPLVDLAGSRIRGIRATADARTVADAIASELNPPASGTWSRSLSTLFGGSKNTDLSTVVNPTMESAQTGGALSTYVNPASAGTALSTGARVKNPMSTILTGGQPGVNLRWWLNKHGYNAEQMGEIIGRKTGKVPEEVLDSFIPQPLAQQLASMTPGFESPTAVQEAGKSIGDLMTMWKATTLAHPASRVRDFAGGVIQNALKGHLNLEGLSQANRIQRGQLPIGDLLNLPEVQDLATRQRISPEEALRIIGAVEAPRDHGIIADLVPGQVGAQLEDMVGQIPGGRPSSLKDLAQRTLRALRYGEHDKYGNPIGGNPFDPRNIAGVGEREHTAFGPAASSQVVSSAGDQFNRLSGIYSQMARGVEGRRAGMNTRSAQVDYNPENFSPFERRVLKSIFPFYSYTSRMTGDTARELLSRPGGATAQLIKQIDRTNAKDPTIPDYLLESTALPLTPREDGTKRILAGLGLMTDPAVKLLGQAAGGNLRGIGYNLASQLNPLIKTPLEYTTGQSFFRDGEQLAGLDPNIGRTLGNIGEMVGLREKGSPPVTFTGSDALEHLVSMSPFSRWAGTARSLTDTRKNALEKIVNNTTGLRVTDVSPQKQTRTLAKRAEALATEAGAKPRLDVYFSKQELERLAKVNPKLAEKQRRLQQLMVRLRRESKKQKQAN